MARILGIHGIAQQFKGGPELTHPWWLAARGGLEAAGSWEAADNLAETDMRVFLFGDPFCPSGAMPVGGAPLTAADINPGPERELLPTLYRKALKREPLLGPTEDSLGVGRVAVQVMLDRLLRSQIFAGIAQRALIGYLKQVTAFLARLREDYSEISASEAELQRAVKVLVDFDAPHSAEALEASPAIQSAVPRQAAVVNKLDLMKAADSPWAACNDLISTALKVAEGFVLSWRKTQRIAGRKQSPIPRASNSFG